MWFIVIGAAVLGLALLGRRKMGADSSVTLDGLDNGATGGGETAPTPEQIERASLPPSAPVYAPVTRGTPPASRAAGPAPVRTAPVPPTVPRAPVVPSIGVSNKALMTRLGR